MKPSKDAQDFLEMLLFITELQAAIEEYAGKYGKLDLAFIPSALPEYRLKMFEVKPLATA